jgi:hypothetical protein
MLHFSFLPRASAPPRELLLQKFFGFLSRRDAGIAKHAEEEFSTLYSPSLSVFLRETPWLILLFISFFFFAPPRPCVRSSSEILRIFISQRHSDHEGTE